MRVTLCRRDRGTEQTLEGGVGSGKAAQRLQPRQPAPAQLQEQGSDIPAARFQKDTHQHRKRWPQQAPKYHR